LLIASKNGHLDVVRELLACGAIVNAASNSGATPLIVASRRGHIEIVGTLLAAGANKHLAQNNGKTARMRAGRHPTAPPGSRAAILALLATAP
jgi:ankyrin repeat protein